MWIQRDCGDGSSFWSHVVEEYGLRHTARLVGVDPRTISRWSHGKDRCSYESIDRVVDELFPMSRGSLPICNCILDGRSRVVGVSDYTRRSAHGIKLRS